MHRNLNRGVLYGQVLRRRPNQRPGAKRAAKIKLVRLQPRSRGTKFTHVGLVWNPEECCTSTCTIAYLLQCCLFAQNRLNQRNDGTMTVFFFFQCQSCRDSHIAVGGPRRSREYPSAGS